MEWLLTLLLLGNAREGREYHTEGEYRARERRDRTTGHTHRETTWLRLTALPSNDHTYLQLQQAGVLCTPQHRVFFQKKLFWTPSLTVAEYRAQDLGQVLFYPCGFYLILIEYCQSFLNLIFFLWIPLITSSTSRGCLDVLRFIFPKIMCVWEERCQIQTTPTPKKARGVWGGRLRIIKRRNSCLWWLHFPRKIEENITDTKNNIRFSTASPFYDFKNQSVLFSIVSGKEKKKRKGGRIHTLLIIFK